MCHQLKSYNDTDCQTKYTLVHLLLLVNPEILFLSLNSTLCEIILNTFKKITHQTPGFRFMFAVLVPSRKKMEGLDPPWIVTEGVWGKGEGRGGQRGGCGGVSLKRQHSEQRVKLGRLQLINQNCYQQPTSFKRRSVACQLWNLPLVRKKNGSQYESTVKKSEHNV